jgi:predicted DNA-binding ribbon-helix-helix protein
VSDIVKRSVVIDGHRTSVSLEPAFWEVLKEIAERRALSINKLIAEIDRGRTGNLSSAIRVFVLRTVRGQQQPTPPAPEEAGRG